MENIQHLSLDIMNNYAYDSIFTKQYDVGRQIIFHITENGEHFNVSNVTAVINIKKPDGTFIMDDCVINEDGTIGIEVTEQMTVCEGISYFDLSLIENNKVISTITGQFNVTPAPVKKDDVESLNEYSVITDILLKVGEATQSALNAKTYQDNAKTYMDSAEQYCNSANSAKESASLSASTATEQATIASNNASTAITKAAEALDSANSAETSKNTAIEKAQEISGYANLSKSYAVGTDNTERENDSTDNSKYYYEQAKQILENINNLLPPYEIISETEPTTDFWLQEY